MEPNNGKIGNAVTGLPNFEVNFGVEKIVLFIFFMKLKILLPILNPLFP